MKPAPFDYHAPDSVEQALELLRQYGDEARVLAGGQSLVPMLNFRLARPAVLIDINGVAGIDAIAAGEGALRFGALVRERAAERSTLVRQRSPLLAAALPWIGHDAIRTRGTIGGSMAHADPAAELPAVAIAAGARMTVRSAARGERIVAADDFFQGYFSTAIEPDEMLVEIEIPDSVPGTGVSFEEVARRQGDFAMVGALAAVHLSDSGTVDDVRLALISVAERAVRAAEAEASLMGIRPDARAFAEAGALAVRDLEPASDLHGTSAYRKHVAERLVRRALANAVSRAGAK
ncbi:MAG: xanthine dehydrogenase family protein subunit M [Acidimicrobiia bacterium]